MTASGTAKNPSGELFKNEIPFSLDDEDAIVNLLTCSPCNVGIGLCGCQGVNWGRITIGTGDSRFVMSFRGCTYDLSFNLSTGQMGSGRVAGGFRVVDGEGEFDDLSGLGRYTGEAATLFSLTFDGWFVAHSD
jgi:hypothetical protein